MNKQKMLVLVVLALALLIPSTVALAKNVKYTFEDVTFSDGTEGVIEAAVKQNKKTEFTSCEYFAADYGAFLGLYQEDTFFDDAGAVETFCLANYENRQ